MIRKIFHFIVALLIAFVSWVSSAQLGVFLLGIENELVVLFAAYGMIFGVGMGLYYWSRCNPPDSNEKE